MRLLGNILWLILGDLFLAASWAVIGVVPCVTIIGIPFGIQSFKMAKLALWPFGSQIRSL
ncbi:YccF domain-containing protein [Bifidobacterium pseudocatenulatum]|uniref:YccF domain-containing protein n=1 Tax=Bifidobacterium pseudocatenulatum TaxID=28026 RepID=UPI0031EF3788